LTGLWDDGAPVLDPAVQSVDDELAATVALQVDVAA
jgi:hypothetical protein